MNLTDPSRPSGDSAQTAWSEDAHLLRRAIEASSSGITIADARQPDLPLIYVNPAFERMTGYSGEACMGRNCRFLQGEDRQQPGLDVVRHALREGTECKVVLRNYRKDGSMFWNEFTIAPIRDQQERLTHFVGVQHDITDRMRLEQTRDQFFQIASHDLKNPLSAILSTAWMVREVARPGEPVSEQLHEITQNIYVRAREMQQIIEDYLDFQALDEGRIQVSSSPVDLARIATEAVDRHVAYARSKNIELRADVPEGDQATALGDATKCMQVAQNLVSNALKFSAEESAVDVRVEPRAEWVHLTVSDQGPGLKQEDLEKVFTRFARLSNRPTGGEKSSGLGLYICKQLVEAMGGHIGVQNNPERGATFWVRLPRL